MHEARNSRPARGLQKRKRATKVGSNRFRGRMYASVHMRFGGEVNYRIGARSFEHLEHARFIADVGTFEMVAGVAGDRLQVLQIAGIGQLVNVGDRPGEALSQYEPDKA